METFTSLLKTPYFKSITFIIKYKKLYMIWLLPTSPLSFHPTFFLTHNILSTQPPYFSSRASAHSCLVFALPVPSIWTALHQDLYLDMTFVVVKISFIWSSLPWPSKVTLNSLFHYLSLFCHLSWSEIHLNILFVYALPILRF